MNLTNQFLIAMPTLGDPNFHRTVTYMCAHNDEGAMGIVINRPLELNLGEVLGHMDIESTDPRVNDMPVLAGRPRPTRARVCHPLPDGRHVGCRARRYRRDRHRDIERHSRGHGLRRGDQNARWSRWDTRAGARGSSSARSRTTLG